MSEYDTSIAVDEIANRYSAFLFAQPSVLAGVARVLDIGGTWNQYNQSVDGENADFYALKADWLAVQTNLSNSILNYTKSLLV